MNENEEMQVMAQEIIDSAQSDVQTPAPVVPEAKKGMTTGQKMAGLGLIGFAIAGIVWLVMSVVKGIKKLVGKIKKPKAVAPAPAQQAVAPAATPEQPAPQTNVQAEETPEQ